MSVSDDSDKDSLSSIEAFDTTESIESYDNWYIVLFKNRMVYIQSEIQTTLAISSVKVIISSYILSKFTLRALGSITIDAVTKSILV